MAIVKDVKPAKAAPAKPIKPIVKPVIAQPNIVNRAKPQAQASPWTPPGVAGVGGMNRPYLGAPMRPNALPTGRIPGTFQAVAPPPALKPTNVPYGYDRRNAPGIFPSVPTPPVGPPFGGTEQFQNGGGATAGRGILEGIMPFLKLFGLMK